MIVKGEQRPLFCVAGILVQQCFFHWKLTHRNFRPSKSVKLVIYLIRVPLTWKTSKSQGICHGIPKVTEFCCLKLIFSQVEDPNFKNYLGEHPQTPANGLRHHGRALSWSGKVREFYIVWRVATLSYT